jgi:hypothetical protein
VSSSRDGTETSPSSSDTLLPTYTGATTSRGTERDAATLATVMDLCLRVFAYGRAVKEYTNSCVAPGYVRWVKKHEMQMGLKRLVCAGVGDKIALSRKVDRHKRLVGCGGLVDGEECEARKT